MDEHDEPHLVPSIYVCVVSSPTHTQRPWTWTWTRPLMLALILPVAPELTVRRLSSGLLSASRPSAARHGGRTPRTQTVRTPTVRTQTVRTPMVRTWCEKDMPRSITSLSSSEFLTSGFQVGSLEEPGSTQSSESNMAASPSTQ